MVRILLFGSPAVFLAGHEIRLSRRKTRALLFYLAGHRQGLAREHLLRVFWLDTPRVTAQQLLRNVLHGLRKALGAENILSESDQVELGSEVWVDAQTFEKALDQANPSLVAVKQALELFRGDFLQDFELEDSPAFDAWVTTQREYYRRLAIRGWVLVSHEAEQKTDYRQALAFLERALSFNPLQEDLQREAIRLQTLAGDRPGAIARYDQLRQLLDEEMGVPPMAETRRLYDQIIKDDLIPIASPVVEESRAKPARGAERLPFVGRKAEVEHLLKTLQTQSGLILVEGEPGVGKTRLVQEVLGSTPGVLLVGRGRDLEKSLPYQPWFEALRSLTRRPQWADLRLRIIRNLAPVWIREVSRLLPELAPDSGVPLETLQSADEARLWEGLHQFLMALGQLIPVTIFLDDLHLADTSTLGLLGYLVRQSGLAGVHVIATAHPQDASTPFSRFLLSLQREDCLTRMSISTLTPQEVGKIAQRLTRAQDADRLSLWLWQFSEGNAFILVELVRYLYQTGAISAQGDLDVKSLSETPIVPQSVYSLILSRLGRLSETARRVFDAAVAAGREFEFPVVAAAAGLSETAAVDGLDELLRAGMVLPLQGDLFYFDHPLTMEVGYLDGGELRHSLLHRRVAEAIESVHRDRLEAYAGVLARHFAEGKALERAAPYALQAGRNAFRLAAWAEAIPFFETAREGFRDLHARAQAWISQAEAQANAGQFSDATHNLKAVRDYLGDQAEKSQLDRIYRTLLTCLLSQARFNEVMELANELIQGQDLGLRIQAELMWGSALSLEGSDLEAAAHHLLRAREMNQAFFPDDLTRQAHINFELGSVAAQQGHLDQAILYYQEARKAAQSGGSENGVDYWVLSLNNLAYHLLLKGEVEQAEAIALQGLERAEERGVIALKTYLLSTLGEIALAKGDFEQAESLFLQGLGIAERIHIPERVAGLTANLGLTALRKGKREQAEQLLHSALDLSEKLGTVHLSAQIQLWLAPLLPHLQAVELLSRVRQWAEKSGRQGLLQEVAQVQALLPL